MSFEEKVEELLNGLKGIKKSKEINELQKQLLTLQEKNHAELNDAERNIKEKSEDLLCLLIDVLGDCYGNPLNYTALCEKLTKADIFESLQTVLNTNYLYEPLIKATNQTIEKSEKNGLIKNADKTQVLLDNFVDQQTRVATFYDQLFTLLITGEDNQLNEERLKKLGFSDEDINNLNKKFFGVQESLILGKVTLDKAIDELTSAIEDVQKKSITDTELSQQASNLSLKENPQQPGKNRPLPKPPEKVKTSPRLSPEKLLPEVKQPPRPLSEKPLPVLPRKPENKYLSNIKNQSPYSPTMFPKNELLPPNILTLEQRKALLKKQFGGDTTKIKIIGAYQNSLRKKQPSNQKGKTSRRPSIVEFNFKNDGGPSNPLEQRQTNDDDKKQRKKTF